MSTLLDAAFLSELEALRRRLEIHARSGAAGDQSARRKGGSAEFQDHRAYTPGDDLRRVDWAAYARTGEPVVKLFRTEEDVVMRVMIDTSLSMAHGNPPKFDVARRMAAALGYMALASSQRAQVAAVSNRIDQMGRGGRGRGGLAPYLRSLEDLQTRGETNLAKAIDELVGRSYRPGMITLISDFLDPGPVTAALSRAKAAGHDLAVVQVATPDEIEPTHEGDWTLEDAETGQTVDVTMDAGAVEAYVLRFAGLCEELRAFARKHGAIYVRLRTDESLEPAVRRFVARGAD